MFFQGDLQAGIAKALQEQRLMGCFVCDDSARSVEWEKSWLADDELQTLFESRVVLLRLVSGSQEAGFLAAFCPIPSVPSLLIIHNGQVQTKLTADLSEESFKTELRNALSEESRGSSSTQPTTSIEQPSTSNTSTIQSEEPSSTSTGPVQTTLAERRARLDEDKASKDAAEASHRKARAEARRHESTDLEPPNNNTSRRGSQTTHAMEVKKAKAEAKAERERILKRIEDDKAARKAKEAHRRATSKTEAENRSSTSNDRPGSNGSASASASSPAAAGAGAGAGTIKECALQVRLFDGRSIRKRFSTWKTLRTHVRPWIDAERDHESAQPYTLRQVLVPMPNRTIEVGEEDEDLEALGLYPSATLVMVPVKGYTEAYGGSPGAMKGVTGIVSGGVGMIGSALGSFFSRSPPSSPPSGRGRFELGGDGEETEEREPQQLYNGSGINVEPRNELKREDSWG